MVPEEVESQKLEQLRQRQAKAEQELEELKTRREERRRLREEEEHRREEDELQRLTKEEVPQSLCVYIRSSQQSCNFPWSQV